ncbi:hypothetical protein [Viscerimonas tarda]
MAKIYNIESNQKSNLSECHPFDTTTTEEVNESSSAYNEVLKILKEAFSLVDITKIFNRL